MASNFPCESIHLLSSTIFQYCGRFIRPSIRFPFWSGNDFPDVYFYFSFIFPDFSLILSTICPTKEDGAFAFPFCGTVLTQFNDFPAFLTDECCQFWWSSEKDFSKTNAILNKERGIHPPILSEHPYIFESSLWGKLENSKHFNPVSLPFLFSSVLIFFSRSWNFHPFWMKIARIYPFSIGRISGKDPLYGSRTIHLSKHTR